jgi:hypothetical protein
MYMVLEKLLNVTINADKKKDTQKKTFQQTLNDWTVILL